MKMLPLMANSPEFGAVVIGHSQIAVSKVQALLKADTQLAVAARHPFCDELSTLMLRYDITEVSLEEAFTNNARFPLVILAEDDLDWLQAQSALLRQQGRLVNVVSHSELSNIELPYLIHQHPLTVAISSDINTANLSETQGEVYLVGAGPGDPELLTLRAVRLIQQADVVLYDRLVAAEIVDLCRPDAERIYVGKARADHAVPQGEINQLLADLALQGKRVLRLKGGDPFIFGRGGEEIETLSQYQIPFQVVPGITAASGCAAYAGIPLTHRDYAQSVRFITGHLKDGSTNLPWAELASPAQTLVFYMGLVGLPEICAQLVAHGLSASTPMALIQQGTTRNQRNIIATLGTMAAHIKEMRIEPPTLIIVGEVVGLHDKLNWFKPEQASGSQGF
ncbi:uroporphyrin-III C-methyltransferase [Oceanospirillum multiglobuliferum]|uniref:uroporphyrinogen-III C-methyltransferase n=1 Tax=Oceanospirillum multiglobuliferum TaxID=64969 RepID=UPI000999A611|nr:uroporphyrinogen-III C-methyltransferase [Oceanospirillum multiglobuliferum]SJZ66604.1 uroporphyrin-III C-methyltransferase [Oceanospirillum multiglobuliferum]